MDRIFAHIMLVVAIFQLIIAYSLYSGYRESRFHQLNARLFVFFGIFFFINGLIALSRNQQQVIAYQPFLSISHLLFTVILDSLFCLYEKKLYLPVFLRRILIFAPFVSLIFVDVLFPGLTFDDPVLTRYGWVYVNKIGLPAMIYYSLVYLSGALTIIVFALILYFQTTSLLKKNFIIYFLITYFVPIIVFLFITNLFSKGTNLNIPFFVVSGVLTSGIIIFFIQKYSVFDITPEIATRNIMSNVSNMVFLLDVKGKIVTTNDIVYKTMALSKEELINTDFFKYVKEDIDVQALVDKTKTIKGHQTILTNHKGKLLTVILTASEVIRKRHSLGYVLIANDITAIERLTDEKRKSELDLMLFQSQMNPHFIFNALNTVSYLINNNEKEQTNLYLNQLAILFRKILKLTGQKLITIEEEVEMLEAYLKIESLRFGNEFNYHIEVKGNDDTYLFEIPPMIVQPLVENAIWHGLAGKEGDKILEVSVTEKKGEVSIKVSNNSSGNNKSVNSQEYPGHNGKSIKNIRERLEIFNKNNHECNAELELCVNKTGKTTAQIKFKSKVK